MSVWWWVGSDKGIIYWGEESSISVHWFRFLTDVPRFKFSATVHVVYRVPCGSCDMSYVGETGRTLHLRIKEHRRALTNGDPCMSALAEHAINHHHNIAWEDVTVVDADPHMYHHRTLEVWHIHQEPKPMNRDRGLLPPVYDSLIRTHPPPDAHLCR